MPAARRSTVLASTSRRFARRALGPDGIADPVRPPSLLHLRSSLQSMGRRVRYRSFWLCGSSLIGLLVAAAGCGSGAGPVTERRTAVPRRPVSTQERAGASVGAPRVHRLAPPHGTRANKGEGVRKSAAARHSIAPQAHRTANRSVASDHNAEEATEGHRPPGPEAGGASGRDPNCCESGSPSHHSPPPVDANTSP